MKAREFFTWRRVLILSIVLLVFTLPFLFFTTVSKEEGDEINVSTRWLRGLQKRRISWNQSVKLKNNNNNNKILAANHNNNKDNTNNHSPDDISSQKNNNDNSLKTDKKKRPIDFIESITEGVSIMKEEEAYEQTLPFALRPPTRSKSNTVSQADPTRREKVLEAMKFAWNGYDQKCWGQDQLRPDTGSCHRWFNLGATIIDSLDTLWLMGLKDEFGKAKQWVSNMRFENVNDVPFFEVVIRILGGLLSAYDLSKEQIFLDKAKDLADRLMPAFNTGTGLPASSVSLSSGQTTIWGWAGGAILSEIGTVQMEFMYLSHVTGDDKYREKAHKVIDFLDKHRSPMSSGLGHPGLYPLVIDPHSGQWRSSKLGVGASADSFYEYLLKAWLLTGKNNDQYLRMYKESAKDIIDFLLVKIGGYSIIAEYEGGKGRTMEHLVCFAPGMFVLGVMTGAVTGSEADKHLEAAEGVLKSCVDMYFKMPTGLSPDRAGFENDGSISRSYPPFLLRPETLESLFLMWRHTHDTKYRDWAWRIFEAIEKNCKSQYGYSGLNDVGNAGSKNDLQESFFLAEVLKYLWLIYSDDSVLSLDTYVINTEAHPLTAFH